MLYKKKKIYEKNLKFIRALMFLKEIIIQCMYAYVPGFSPNTLLYGGGGGTLV